MINWTRDDGYCCEETAHRGDFAAVIVPPDWTGNGWWGIQIFDEADDEAIERGEYWTYVEHLPTASAAKRIAETILEELDAART